MQNNSQISEHVLYREVADRMIERLDLVCLQPQRILCDVGYLTDLLSARYPEAIICHDLSPSEPLVDLVFSNLMLKEDVDLAETILAWHQALNPEGLLMFSVFGFWDMHNIGDILVKTRFADPVMDREEFILTYVDEQVLQEDIAVLGSPQQQGPDDAGGLSATYEVINGHAWRPLADWRPDEQGEVHFPLAWLRRSR